MSDFWSAYVLPRESRDARELRATSTRESTSSFATSMIATCTNHTSLSNGTMAIEPLLSSTSNTITDNASDYGSDIDDATAIELLSQAESEFQSQPQPLTALILESVEEPDLRDDEAVEERAVLRLPRSQRSADSAHKIVDENGGSGTQNSTRPPRRASPPIEVEYDERNRASFSPSGVGLENTTNESDQQSHTNTTITTTPDPRPPLTRFRASRPLSVTDLVSPAWCEQQYEYSLSKYGRVRKTPAMRQGSSVHRQLEEQVHVRVPVETVSKEDRFGLRVWNSIQGLRQLRREGLTREVEVWGVLEGEVVIGVIDEIRSVCPDEGMEARILGEEEKSAGGGKGGKKKKEEPSLPSDQRTLTEFLTASQSGTPALENHASFLGTLRDPLPTYYLVDVKTRQSKTLPAVGASLRPTNLQLMLYHRLLSALAANEVPADEVFTRYKLDANATFSDKFIAEIANLDPDATPSSFANEHGDDDDEELKDSLTELLDHNTLSSLWTLLVAEAARTFPAHTQTHPPLQQRPSISALLTAEFRSARPTYASDNESDILFPAGALIGHRSFAFDAARAASHLRDELAWWRGERPTLGVDVEEAFKCRICEFADACGWRKTKVEEGLRKARLRREEGAGTTGRGRYEV